MSTEWCAPKGQAVFRWSSPDEELLGGRPHADHRRRQQRRHGHVDGPGRRRRLPAVLVERGDLLLARSVSLPLLDRRGVDRHRVAPRRPSRGAARHTGGRRRRPRPGAGHPRAGRRQRRRMPRRHRPRRRRGRPRPRARRTPTPT